MKAWLPFLGCLILLGATIWFWLFSPWADTLRQFYSEYPV